MVERVLAGKAEVLNAFPRCVGRDGNGRALEVLRRVFVTGDGEWRGIARVPNGDLRLRPEFSAHDASVRFASELSEAPLVPERADAAQCRCGAIMTGRLVPTDCSLFGRQCVPDNPVGACMVSSEGTCKIWHQYGGHPDLGGIA